MRPKLIDHKLERDIAKAKAMYGSKAKEKLLKQYEVVVNSREYSKKRTRKNGLATTTWLIDKNQLEKILKALGVSQETLDQAKK